MVEATESFEGERLLTAVERIVAGSDQLIAQVEAYKEEIAGAQDPSSPAVLERTAARIIALYSTRSAIAGGATALPGVFPVGGTLVAAIGGSLADMALMLKYEVEMSLCLTHLYGHDIREERERLLAYVLAAVGVFEVKSGRNYFVDLADTGVEAFAKYTPRQLSKLAASVFTKCLLLKISQRFIRVLPLIGVVVGVTANKLVTHMVGWQCVRALARWRGFTSLEQPPIIDAKIT
jgi:uncharacterized protein (DUF697 family)